MTALIIEDNEACRALLEEFLSEKQFQVTAFSDVVSYLNQLENDCCSAQGNGCFDLILTDNQMPGMTGLEFLEMVREKGCLLPDYRKGIISGTWSYGELTRARNLKCRIFSKPAFLTELEEWLDNLQS